MYSLYSFKDLINKLQADGAAYLRKIRTEAWLFFFLFKFYSWKSLEIYNQPNYFRESFRHR